MANASRFNFFLALCLLFMGILGSSLEPSLAAGIPAYDPSHYDKIFGKPEDFVKKLESEMAPKLNEYLGLGVSVSGFILVIRSLVK